MNSLRSRFIEKMSDFPSLSPAIVETIMDGLPPPLVMSGGERVSVNEALKLRKIDARDTQQMPLWSYCYGGEEGSAADDGLLDV